MTSAIDTNVTATIIFILLERGTRALVRCGNFRRGFMVVCSNDVTLHGMSTFVRDMYRHGQHQDQEHRGNKFQGDKYSHKVFGIMSIFT